MKINLLLVTFIVAIVTLSVFMTSTRSTLINRNINSVVQINVEIEKEVDGSPWDEALFQYGERNNQQLRPYTRTEKALGTGFFIDDKGTIVTNFHVAGKASKINIDFFDGTQDTAKYLGGDEQQDIAILRIDHLKDHKFIPLQFGDSSKINLGEPVVAIGSPFGLSFTVTKGIVSSTERHDPFGKLINYVQTDASINPGNSGGPLFNQEGEVIGINDAILSKTGTSNGLGLALPSNAVKNAIEKIEKYGKISRGQLGIEIQDIDDGFAAALGVEKKGVYVGGVVTGGAAHGLIYHGDIIISIDNKEMKNVDFLRTYITSLDPGTVVSVVINRDGKIITSDVTLLLKK